MDHTHIMNISWGGFLELDVAQDSQSAEHDGDEQILENITWGDSGEIGQAQGSQCDEHDGNEQNPKKITASERLSELVKTKTLSHDLYDVAANVLQELDSVKKKNENLEEKIICLNNSNSQLEQKKDYLESFSRRILCPRRLKFIMENFAKNYLPVNPDPVIKRFSEIDEKLLDVTDMFIKFRSKKTLDLVHQFLSLSLQEKYDDSFINSWMSMKRILYQVQPDVAEIIRNNDLSSAFIQLHKATNRFDALQIFNRQKCNVWQSRNEILSVNDIETLEALSCISVDDALVLIQTEGFQLLKVEEEYARHSFEIGPSVVKAENKQYKLCRLILMSSCHSAIINICHQLEARWPDQRSKWLHWYSSNYAKLFKIVSCQDVFGPLFQPPVSYICNNPTTQEFYEYIEILKRRWSSDVAFVAETLCIL